MVSPDNSGENFAIRMLRKMTEFQLFIKKKWWGRAKLEIMV